MPSCLIGRLMALIDLRRARFPNLKPMLMRAPPTITLAALCGSMNLSPIVPNRAGFRAISLIEYSPLPVLKPNPASPNKNSTGVDPRYVLVTSAA